MKILDTLIPMQRLLKSCVEVVLALMSPTQNLPWWTQWFWAALFQLSKKAPRISTSCALEGIDKADLSSSRWWVGFRWLQAAGNFGIGKWHDQWCGRTNPSNHVVMTVSGDHWVLFIDMDGQLMWMLDWLDSMRLGRVFNRNSVEIALTTTRQFGDQDINKKIRSSFYHLEWQHQANCTITCTTVDCWWRGRSCGRTISSGQN
jgi:hypothetical protein